MWITVATGARVRRTARWVLLTCTVVGLASMHTLGHGRAAGSSYPSPDPALLSSAPALLSSAPALLSPRPVSSAGHHLIGFLVGGLLGGSHSEERESGGGHGAVWSVCLAVLVALTVAVLLLAWLLRWWRRAGVLAFAAGPVISRSPPRSGGVGLLLAATSVLRI